MAVRLKTVLFSDVPKLKRSLQDYAYQAHHQHHIIAASQADYSADISMFQACHTGHTQQLVARTLMPKHRLRFLRISTPLPNVASPPEINVVIGLGSSNR